MLVLSLRQCLLAASFITLGIGACAADARCGDGVVDAGEICDDGNLRDGDGCNAACQLDDDVRTVGDDRAGYKQCAPAAPGEPSLVCGPGLGCCPEGFCAPSGQDCQSPFGFVDCDGDEDCASPDQHCWVYKTTSCGWEAGYSLRCHVDEDCPGPVFECRSGTCPMFSDPPTP